MSFNGSGTFVRSYNWTSDATNGILIRSDRMDGEDNGFATGLSTVICKDGQTTTTAAIPFAVGIKVNDGTVSTPSIAFTSEISSGLFRASALNVALAVSGINTANFSSNNMTAGTHYTVSSATPLYNAGTATGYLQHSLQNLSSGTTASTDVVCTADTGTDTTNYVNLGVNSSGYSGTAPFNLALDGYLYTQSANLNIGTVAAKVLNFATNNTVVGSFDASGNFSINTNQFTVSGSTGNTAIAGTLAVTGSVTFSTLTATTLAGNVNFSGVPTMTAAPSAGDTTNKLAAMANFAQAANGASEVLIGTATASNSASIQFTNIPSGYDQYELRLTNVIPATGATSVQMLFSENNGSSYITANYQYAQIYANNSGGGKGDSSSSSSNIELGSAVQNGNVSGIIGKIILQNLGSSSIYKAAKWEIGYVHSSAYIQSISGFGYYTGDTNVVNAIQVNFSFGNITSGKFALYGIRNA